MVEGTTTHAALLVARGSASGVLLESNSFATVLHENVSCGSDCISGSRTSRVKTGSHSKVCCNPTTRSNVNLYILERLHAQSSVADETEKWGDRSGEDRVWWWGW